MIVIASLRVGVSARAKQSVRIEANQFEIASSANL